MKAFDVLWQRNVIDVVTSIKELESKDSLNELEKKLLKEYWDVLKTLLFAFI